MTITSYPARPPIYQIPIIEIPFPPLKKLHAWVGNGIIFKNDRMREKIEEGGR